MEKIPQMLAIDIDATQKVLDAAAEILNVALKGGSIISYVGLIDDLGSILKNMKEAKGEIKEGLNVQEIQLLMKNNISEKLKMFGVLQSKSKYGIDNILFAVSVVAQIIAVIEEAVKDGLQVTDIKYLSPIFQLILSVYMIREKIILEAKDIQAQEAEDILAALFEYIYWIIKK